MRPDRAVFIPQHIRQNTATAGQHRRNIVLIVQLFGLMIVDVADLNGDVTFGPDAAPEGRREQRQHQPIADQRGFGHKVDQLVRHQPHPCGSQQDQPFDTFGESGGKARRDRAAHGIPQQGEAAGDILIFQQVLQLLDKELAILRARRTVGIAAPVKVIGQRPVPHRRQPAGDRAPDNAGGGQPVDANDNRALGGAGPRVMGHAVGQLCELAKGAAAVRVLHFGTVAFDHKRDCDDQSRNEKKPDHL